MAKGQLCYQCFERFKPHQVWFRCDNTTPEKNKTEACPIVTDPKRKEKGRRPFPLHGLTAAFTSQWMRPKHSYCDHCGVKSVTRICPHCHWRLPSEYGELAEHIIAVIGNSSSGKSHYFTVLVEKELKGAIGRAFGSGIDFGDNETKRLYLTEYYRPLFDGKHTIPPTSIDNHRHRRLIFSLALSKLKVKLTFVFYDIAGELLSRTGDDDAVTNATRYLWNASGMIYLVNPNDVVQWAPYLQDVQARAEPPSTLFGQVTREFRKNTEIGTKQIQVPVAVCISQFDRLRERRNDLGLSDELFDPVSTPIRGGRIDETRIKNESDVLENFMRETGGDVGNLVALAEKDFSHTRYFGASALGDSPKGPEQSVDEVKPCRVGVPFFWILSRLGTF